MAVKDRVVTWYIQNIIIPRREIIDKPGFIITAFTEHKKTTYLRDIFLPEQLFEIIEKRIIECFGERGKQVLYSAGKKNGYIYSSLSNFPTIQRCTKKEFSDFTYLLVRFVEGTYAKEAKYEINIDEKMFNIYFKDYIICRHNGLGYIMTDGGIAGIWAYAMQDKTVEGIQIECQGRGNQQCYIICAPEVFLLKKTPHIFHELDLSDQKSDSLYKTMNEIRKTIYSKNSLKDLLNAGFFEFKQGILSYKKNRFFFCDSHILYLLEQEIAKLDGGEQVLFNACFEYGKLLQETYGYKDYQKFIPDFFSALGFGEVRVLDPTKPSIASVYYPWTIFSETSKYIIFRGIVSGFVSSSLGKQIEFKTYNIVVKNYLTLTITV
ncbi:MAG: hypothetical protein NT038_03215 [Euryarchaeota archaeon]|nr:hypothetical protein [Euryarchaeota archaeon]